LIDAMARTSKASARAAPTLPSKTFIIDNGGYNIKAGFAPSKPIPDGEALTNCHSIPNTIVRSRDKKTYVGAQSEEVSQWSEALFRRPVENGQVVSWEAQKEIWDQSFFDDRTARKQLHVKNPEETTLIFTESPNTMPALQKNADEIIMEEWGFGGYSRVIGRYDKAFSWILKGQGADHVAQARLLTRTMTFILFSRRRQTRQRIA
jgi:actin-related protein 6